MLADDLHEELLTTAADVVAVPPRRGPALWGAARASRARATELRARLASARTRNFALERVSDASPTTSEAGGGSTDQSSLRLAVPDPRWDRIQLRHERAVNAALRTTNAQLLLRLAEAEAEIKACNAEMSAMNREIQDYFVGGKKPLQAGGQP